MSLEDLAGLLFRPAFEYEDCGVPLSCEFAIPQRPWTYRSTAIGGYDQSAAGVQESFMVRHDRIYVLHLRMTETEWVELFEPMMAVLWQQAQEFVVYLDANDPTTAHDVVLVGPWMTEGIEAKQHDCPGVLEVDIALRTVDGSAFTTVPYFPDLDEVLS